MKKLRVFVIRPIFQRADELSPEKREILLHYEHGFRILAPSLHAAPSRIDEFNLGVLCTSIEVCNELNEKTPSESLQYRAYG